MELAQLVATYGGGQKRKQHGAAPAASSYAAPQSFGGPQQYGSFAPPFAAAPSARGGRGRGGRGRGQSHRGAGRGRGGSFAPPRGGNFAPPTAVAPAASFQPPTEAPDYAADAQSDGGYGAGYEGYEGYDGQYDAGYAGYDGYSGYEGYAGYDAYGNYAEYADGYQQDWTGYEDGTFQPPSFLPPDAYGGYQNGGFGFASFGVRQQKKPKKKKDKKEPAERTGPPTHFCEPCEKEFWDEKEHANHVKTHVKCEFADCEFTASKKAVTLHALTIHTENPRLKKLMRSLESPEEIAAYIAERRRAFPTKEAVAKQHETDRQTAAAGGSVRGRGRGRGRGLDRGGRGLERGGRGGRVGRGGAAALVASQAAALEGDTGDDDTEDSPPEEASTFDASAAEADSTPYQDSVPICGFFRRGMCRFGNRCNRSHDYNPRKRQKTQQQAAPVKKPSLLEKLMDKNAVKLDYTEILEGLRYIVQNNFFLSA